MIRCPECFVSSNLRIYRVELMHATRGTVTAGFEAVDYSIGSNSRPDVQDRNSNRQIEVTGHAERRHADELMHLEVQPVLCGDNVTLEARFPVYTCNSRTRAAEFWLGFVLKNRPE